MNLIDPDVVHRILNNYQEPLIFRGYLDNWRILKWTLNDWDKKLAGTKLKFRKYHQINSTAPIWEQQCTVVSLTMKEFIKFQNIRDNDSWLYFDYKYMQEWFQNYSDILSDVSWAKFGFPEFSGKDSTIWIGSKGSHTPCHRDTYGYNLAAQVYGRKRWIIFPPSENLKPSRVPYEESSVYSKLNFFNPRVSEFENIKNARIIDLNPGEVLYLPVGWWHYVENIETAISINTWVPLAQDHEKRVEEAFAQILVAQITRFLDDCDKPMILNPNSMHIHEQSLPSLMNVLDRTIEICKDKIKGSVCTIFSNISEASSLLPLEDMGNIIDENNSLRRVPVLQQEEFLSFLRDQAIRHDSREEAENLVPKSSTVITVEKLINAVCHPDVLKLITEKLLED